jgi:hypothetical protein
MLLLSVLCAERSILVVLETQSYFKISTQFIPSHQPSSVATSFHPQSNVTESQFLSHSCHHFFRLQANFEVFKVSRTK